MSRVCSTFRVACSALHWAVDRNHRSLVSALLSPPLFASVNIQDSDGQTPLHYAVTCEYEDIVDLLLAAGARTDIPDSSGETAEQAASGEIKQRIQKAKR